MTSACGSSILESVAEGIGGLGVSHMTKARAVARKMNCEEARQNDGETVRQWCGKCDYWDACPARKTDEWLKVTRLYHL